LNRQMQLSPMPCINGIVDADETKMHRKANVMKYKFLILVLLPVFIFESGCNTTQKLINSGHYDQAIARSVNKLQRNRDKEKQVRLLKEAFDKAQKRDQQRVAYLQKEGHAGSSVEVFKIYQTMKERQNKIKPLLPLYVEGREVPFRLVNVDDELIRWKKEAAGYLYSHAQKLLKEDDKYAARDAYYELVEANEIYPGYRDISHLMNQARNKGMNWVVLEVTNRSPNLVPVEFVEELYNYDYIRLQSEWVQLLPANEHHNVQFDHKVHLVVEIVDVGPEQVKEKEWVETKEIEDGYMYAKNSAGEYVKDSLGNRIKVPKYKEIQCKVIEVKQFKSSTFKGRIEILDMQTNQKLESDPININFVFDHLSYKTEGNIEALSKETKKELGNKPVPFPSDFQMIMDGTTEVKPVVTNYISRHRQLLER
jgi:hypothetical protein